MAGQIKGITIEFDGETTKLTAALNKVKAEAKGIDSELKQVNYGLRFDPRNTELLGQKQTLLKQKIEASKNQLKEFRDIQRQLDEKKVDKTSAAYMKVRREIIAAEGKLKTFNAQLAKTQWSGMKNLGGQIQSVGQKLTHATRYARLLAGALAGIALYKGFERLKSLDEVSKQLEVLGYRGKQLDGIMEDVSGSVNGTRFMLQDMAKVATGALGSGVTEKYKLNEYLTRTADLAQLTGLDVTEMGAMMNKAYSKGKVQAQLMNQFNQRGIPIYKLLQKQLGVSADKLQEMSKAGKITFDDLYKATSRYEGLAEKMGTETLPGALTVLTQQFGLIGADFLSGVYDPLKDGIRGIVAEIKNLRQNGTFKEWGQDLGDTVKFFVTYFKDGEASMLGLSDRAQNLVTVLSPLVKSIGAVVQAIAALPPELQGVLAFMTLFGGPMLTVLGGGVKMFADLGAAVQTFGMNTAAGVGPVSQLSAGIGGMSGIVSALLSPLGLATLGIGAWALGVKKAYDEQHQWTQGFDEWKQKSDESFAAIEANAAEIDVYKSKLDELIKKDHKSAGEKALIKEYVNQLNGAIDGLNLKYDEEKDKLNKTSEAIQKKIDKYKEAAMVKAYEDLITEAAKKEAQAQLDLQDLMEERTAIQKKWEEAADHSAVAEQGYKMALGDVDRKIADVNASMKQYDGEMKRAEKAIKSMSGTTEREMKKSVTTAESAGRDVPKKFSGKIKAGDKQAKSAADSVAKAAKAGLNVNTSGLGVDFANGFKSGILSKCREVASAGAKMVKDAISAARKAQDSGSPSKVMRKVGREYGEGDVLGILDTIPAAKGAAHKLVASSIQAATAPVTGGGMRIQTAAEAPAGGSAAPIVMNWYVNGADDPRGWAGIAADELKVRMNAR